MNKFLIPAFIGCILLFSCRVTQPGKLSEAPSIYIQKKRNEKHKWKLVWEDRFSGRELDSSKWTRIPPGNSDWNTYMSSDPDCYRLSAGKLHLRGIKNTNTSRDTRPYLTGGIYSKGKFAFQYGKIEVRAMLTCAPGAWPAIWLLAEQNKLGEYPRNGEIDIMEHLNYDSIIYQTVHSYYTLNLNQKSNPVNHGTAKLNITKFNTFGLEWNSDALVFTLNGKETFRYPRISGVDASQWPFDRPFYILIDQQLEGGWVGKTDPDKLPVDIIVDWVKVYQ